MAPVPPSSVFIHSPVTFESAGGLTGCAMPDGRGLLVWVNGGSVRMATVPAPRDWMGDDVVSAAEHTLGWGNSYARAAKTFTVGGDVLIVVARADTTLLREQMFTEVYRAVDPADPTAGWVLHGTVQAFVSGEDNWSESSPHISVGVPYVDGSTWLLPATIWMGSGFINYWSTRSGMWRSLDSGATWSNVLDSGYYIIGGIYIDYLAPHVARDPATGALYWTDGGGPYNNGKMWRSDNDGASWSNVIAWEPTPRMMPFMDDGAYLYGFQSSGGVVKQMTDPMVEASWVTVASLFNIGYGSDAAAVLVESVWYFFANGNVQAGPSGGWIIDAIGIG